MIEYSKKVLSNGLRVIIHEDQSTPLVAVNVLYQVGSKDEDPTKTGYAHLFEHLMFSGTENIPDFDAVIQNAGGENNAFTNSDITNYYDVVPAENIEVALWLEADRMNKSTFTKRSLDIQKRVVVEEFKETCLNEPYGDLWHHLAPMAYPSHGYNWPTIGKKIDHIRDAKLEDVQAFFDDFYASNNAIIVLSGNIVTDRGFDLVEKWFGNISPKPIKNNGAYHYDNATRLNKKTVVQNVPLTSLTWAFPMGDRLSRNYYAADLLSDILGSGRSSRMYSKLIDQHSICNITDAFISGTNDPGLFIIENKINTGVQIELVRSIIKEEIDRLKNEYLGKRELQKIKNKAESNLIFSETSTLNKAITLAYFESLGEIDLINEEVNRYQEITVKELKNAAEEIFDMDNMIELVYLPKG